jgi:hypothetical protein
MARKIRLLLQHDDARAGLDLAQAPIGFDPVVDQPEQSGLARAVAADQRKPVARADMKVDRVLVGPAEQPAAALLQAETFPAEDRRLCHGARQVGAGAVIGKAGVALARLANSQPVTPRSRNPSVQRGVSAS